MDQEKIGKFIKDARKAKGLTQEELGEKLGVSEKSISNWENGRNMPDLSLFESLCNELNISVNELIRGEKISDKELKNKTDENIIETINYSNKIVNERNKKISIIMVLLGLFVSIFSIVIDSIDTSITVLGFMFFIIGLYRIIINKKYIFKIISLFGSTFVLLFIYIFLDFVVVSKTDRIPKFVVKTDHYENIEVYHALFYDVYKININDLANSYTIIDTNNKYNINTIPISPYNRNKVGIDALLKYKSNKLDKDNIKKLYNILPFEELEKTINIVNNEIIINYDISINESNRGKIIHNIVTNEEIYIDEDITFYDSNIYNIERNLLYNTISTFFLFEKLEKITFNFNDYSFNVTRDNLKENYNEYKYIIRGNDRPEYFFNNFVEKYMNDFNYIINNFKKIFIDNEIKRTKKIEIANYNRETINDNNVFVEKINETLKKTITSEDDIQSIINIITNSHPLSFNSPVTLEASGTKVNLYDENNNIIHSFFIFQNGTLGIRGKEYYLTEKNKEVFFNIINN